MNRVLDYSKFLYQVYLFVGIQAQSAVSALRTWIGPEPHNYYILADGRVLPATIAIPFDVAEIAFLFDVRTNRFTLATAVNTEGRFRPAVKYLSIVLKQPITNNDIDLSDWVGELRANPVPETLSLQQLVTLWSLVHNRYIPFSYTLALINGDGDNETHTVN